MIGGLNIAPFSALGVVVAEKVDEQVRHIFEQTIEEGNMGNMDYLSRYPSQRFDPAQLLPGCKTIICAALPYFPSHTQPASTYQIAYYAYGRDYHDVMRSYLHTLAHTLNLSTYRVCVDTAPVLERYWALRSGIGFIGRNHTLIIPRLGSYHFLGEILTTESVDTIPHLLPITAERRAPQCGSCRKCIDACPTGALCPDGSFDARRCLSYITIEHRGPFTAEQKALVSSQPTPYYIYGCDRCQRCCPHNMKAKPTHVTDFQPHPMLLDMTPCDWRALTREQYREVFRHSAVKRAKYEGLMRNIQEVSSHCSELTS